jgi:hypothetical protein
MKTKKITITLTPEQQDRARRLSSKILKTENISGLIAHLIDREDQNQTVEALLQKLRNTDQDELLGEEVTILGYIVFLDIRKHYEAIWEEGSEPGDRVPEVLQDEIEIMDYTIYHPGGEEMNDLAEGKKVWKVILSNIVNQYNK